MTSENTEPKKYSRGGWKPGMHRGGPKGASTPTILEELQQDMVANPLLIDTVEYLRAAFPAPIASNEPSPEALAGTLISPPLQLFLLVLKSVCHLRNQLTGHWV